LLLGLQGKGSIMTERITKPEIDTKHAEDSVLAGIA